MIWIFNKELHEHMLRLTIGVSLQVRYNLTPSDSHNKAEQWNEL